MPFAELNRFQVDWRIALKLLYVLEQSIRVPVCRRGQRRFELAVGDGGARVPAPVRRDEESWPRARSHYLCEGL